MKICSWISWSKSLSDKNGGSGKDCERRESSDGGR